MIELTIPGRGPLRIQHLVMDVNGTLAVDGMLIEGVARRLSVLRDRMEIHLITADTHHRQESIDFVLNTTAVRLQPGDEAGQKADFVRSLGSETVAAIGQGANDALMLEAAALGICVMSIEGVATQTLLASDLLLPDILAALDIFDKPLRIIASLRK
jgi:P-type E1-E2 ATPase